MDESKFNSFLTDEGIFQLNPTTPSLIGNHTSTVELAELIDLIADEAEAAKALDNESAVVVAGLLAPQPFEVSVKFAKQHIVVWDVDLEYVYLVASRCSRADTDCPYLATGPRTRLRA